MGRIETNGTIRNKKIGKNMVFIVLVLIFVITAVFVGMKLGVS